MYQTNVDMCVCRKHHALYTQSKGNRQMKDMHIDVFAKALAAFDATLDGFATSQMNRRASSYGWASSSAEPLEEGKHYTISRVFPASNKACGCGSNCSCGEEGRSSSKVRFDDILDDVRQVIFNDPATIVTFSDGSKVCVKACEKDTFNKETGLIYAIIKRLYANDIEEKTGYLRSSGLGEKIAKIVKKATDQKDVERERRRKQKKAKKEAEKKAEMANEVAEQEEKESVEQVYSTNGEK